MFCDENFVHKWCLISTEECSGFSNWGFWESLKVCVCVDRFGPFVIFLLCGTSHLLFDELQYSRE